MIKNQLQVVTKRDHKRTNVIHLNYSGNSPQKPTGTHFVMEDPNDICMHYGASTKNNGKN